MKMIWKFALVAAAVIGVAFVLRGMERGAAPSGPDLQPVATADEATTANWAAQAADAAGGELTAAVYMSPTCGCCGEWVEHLEEHGFDVTVHYRNEMGQVKLQHSVPPDMFSCHTAIIDGYLVEGHTPAPDILRMLAERPDIVGIAVPGMPAGSPGMEVGHTEPYNVFWWDKDGNRNVYASY